MRIEEAIKQVRHFAQEWEPGSGYRDALIMCADITECWEKLKNLIKKSHHSWSDTAILTHMRAFEHPILNIINDPLDDSTD